MQGNSTDLFGQEHKPGKTCRKCRQFKPFDQFEWRVYNGKRKQHRYRHNWCRDCKASNTRAWHSKYRKTKVRDSNYRKHYGITKKEYDAMHEFQQGACAICGATVMPVDPRTGEAYQLAVDHCHECDAVRSLLCPGCNNGLGCFRDDPDRLAKAIQYLKKHVHS